MIKRLSVMAIGLAVLVQAPSAAVAGDANTDWPCVQRKIPKLSAGMMWAGPVVDEATTTLWQSDETLSNLALRLAARRTSFEEVERLVAAYAGSIAVEIKPKYLTALFAGVLAHINKERRQIMFGIEKYTRKQKALAGSIQQTRDQLSKALKTVSTTDEAKSKRRDLEQTLSWQSRIHEERERSLKFVCESPVVLEERAFTIAREIANHLE